LLIEVHPAPDLALCDGPQALTPELFEALMQALPPVLTAVGSRLSGQGHLAAVGGSR
jgi:3-deoxy-7-phosphoheptulonate synthase